MSNRTVLTEYTIESSKITAPLRIALVSDLHERKAPEVLALLQGAAPDLIAVAGDTFERRSFEGSPFPKNSYSLPHRLFLIAAFNLNWFFLQVFGRNNMPKTQNAYDFLEQAARLAPVFLSLGNHAMRLTEDDVAFLRKNGITLLDNAGTELACGGSTLQIGGLSTVADEAWLASFAKKDGFKLLLCHHPEYYDTLLADKPVDLIFAGHNHGGQIRLFRRPLFSAGGGILPKYGYGMYHNRMIVSAGCSNTVAMPRVCNPHELVLVHLKPL